MRIRAPLAAFMAIFAIAALVGVAIAAPAATVSVPNGQGDCLDQDLPGNIKEDTGGTQVTINTAGDEIITSVVVKAGSAQSTDGNQCITFTQNGSNSCYSVSGVGTNSVTVTKIGSGPDCKDISHLEGTTTEPPDPPDDDCEVIVDGTPGEWSDWVDNGNGTQTRTRTVPLEDDADGSPCGSRTETQTIPIDPGVCQQTVDGSPGEWSEWIDNGNGTQTRTRTIPILDAQSGANCGSRSESETVPIDDPCVTNPQDPACQPPQECPKGSHMGDEGECVETKSCPVYIAWLQSFGIFDRLPPRCELAPPKTGATDTVLNVWDQLITAPWWPFR